MTDGKSKESYYLFCKLAAFSLIFAFIFSVGKKMLIGRDPMGVPGVSFQILLFSFIICFSAQLFLYFLLKHIRNMNLDIKEKNSIHLLPFFSIQFFFIYSIAFLCFFPGTSYLDTLVIMRNGMMMGKQYPIFYCFYIVILTKIGEYLGSLRYSLIIYNIIQLAIISVLSGWLCTWIWNKKTLKTIKWFTFLYLAFNPVLAVYSISVIKDTVFSLSVIILVTVIYDLFTKNDTLAHWVFFSFSTACLIIFRNNGIYILIPLLIILFIKFPKYNKKIGILFLEILLLLSAGKALQMRFDFEPLFKESMAIPIQQISAVVKYNEDCMTEEQKSFVDSYLDLSEIKANYDGAYADPIKWHDDFNDDFFNSHKKEFLQLWFQLLPENIFIYIRAYLEETFWYWFPGNNGNTIIITWLGGGVPDEWLQQNGLIISPLLQGNILRLLRYYYLSARKFPSEGIWVWFMFFCCFLRGLFVKDHKSLIIFLPAILCWLTLMFSAPINSETRYALPFMYGIPIFFSLLFIQEKNTESIVETYDG